MVIYLLKLQSQTINILHVNTKMLSAEWTVCIVLQKIRKKLKTIIDFSLDAVEQNPRQSLIRESSRVLSHLKLICHCDLFLFIFFCILLSIMKIQIHDHPLKYCISKGIWWLCFCFKENVDLNLYLFCLIASGVAKLNSIQFLSSADLEMFLLSVSRHKC